MLDTNLSFQHWPQQLTLWAPAQDHPALQLLMDRLQSGSKPGARSDNFKLGLAVEGGGMRGCVTGGGLRALCDMGAR